MRVQICYTCIRSEIMLEEMRRDVQHLLTERRGEGE